MSTSCRRCGKPLTTPLTTAAGVGGRCALLDLADLAEAAPRRSEATPAQTAVALVAAFVHHQDQEIVPLLLEAEPRDVAGLLAAIVAVTLEDQPDGVERLRLAGMRAALAAP